MLAGCDMYLGEMKLFEWKKLLEIRFLLELQELRPNMEIEDWVWKDEECLRYSVKFAYVVLRRDLEEGNTFWYDKFGRVKFFPQLKSLLGRCCLIRLQPRPI